jgi:hypothetical protein
MRVWSTHFQGVKVLTGLALNEAIAVLSSVILYTVHKHFSAWRVVKMLLIPDLDPKEFYSVFPRIRESILEPYNLMSWSVALLLL